MRMAWTVIQLNVSAIHTSVWWLSHNKTKSIHQNMMSLTVTHKKVHFLPWIALSWASSLNLGEWTVKMRCYQTFPTPHSIHLKQPLTKLQSVNFLIPNPVKTSKLNNRVLCSVRCLPADCVFNMPKTTVSAPVPPCSPLSLSLLWDPFTKLISLLIHL